jgi:2-polyprenyl-3-methyl-5-hydroxy-6-metoxy-1,4-benzoquinol methylase
LSGINDISLEPARFLVENAGLLKKGRVLDLAMGHGRNALYLAAQGFEVEGVDLSTEAVQSALEQARALGIKLSAHVADLEDNYPLATSAYDIIICFNYLHRPLIPRIKAGLRPEGMVVYETFIVEQARFGKPKNPDHLLKHNELLDMFRDFRCLRYREGIIGPGKAVAGIVAEKVRTGENMR